MDKLITGPKPARQIDFVQIFENVAQPMSIAEAGKPNALLYVNQAFCDLTGYSREELLGHNAGFLQGSRYSKRREMIREALDAFSPVDVLVLNYRKDGSSFWNDLHLRPVIVDGECIFWVSMGHDATSRVENMIRELEAAVNDVRELRIDLTNMKK